MQIDVIACASANVAPASESTDASPEAGKAPGSFADLLDAVAEDQDESTPADEGDEDEPVLDGWMTVPVVVPIVPVIPRDLVKIGEATSVDPIGEDIATADVHATLPDVAALPDVKSFVDGEAPKPAETKQAAESSVATEMATPANPAIPAADDRPIEIARDVRPEAAASHTAIETTAAMTSREPIAVEPTAKSARAARTVPAPKTADANDAAKGAVTEVSANSAVQTAVIESVSPRAEASNDTSKEPAPSPTGAAARFARAIERAIEHAVAPASGTDDHNQSANQDGDNQPSFSEWLREQLPQLTAGRGHNPSNPAFALVAPVQNDARVAGLLASSGGSLHPNTPALPNEHDVTLQLVQSMRMQFRDGIGEAVLTLKPEHLGSVSISLRVENGGLKANVQADMPAVRQWLESQQDTLRSALAEHGLRLDRFAVEPDAQRQQTDDNPRDAQATRRRQRRRTAQDDEPVFEVVV